MTQTMNNTKIGKFRSLGLLTWYLFFYIIMFVIGVSWALGKIGFGSTFAAAIASQSAIFFLFLAFFKYDVREIKEITKFRVNLDNVVLALKITTVFVFLNIISSQAADFLFPEIAGELTKGNAEKVLTSNNLIMMVVLPVLVAPFVEELAFRAGFKKLLVDRAGWSPKFYVIVSSLTFGLLHFQTGLSGILIVLVTSTIGAINAIVYLKTNNIMIPILSHLFYNFLIIASALVLT